MILKNNLFAYLLILLSVIISKSYAQISINSSSFNSYNVTPNTLCQVSILNSGAAGQVFMEAQVFNASNEALLTVRTNPFQLNQGLNNIVPNTISFANIQYLMNNQGEYLKTQNKLPSGGYTYCVRLFPVANIEEGDEYCETIEGNEDVFLYLVYPSDEEVIETSQPVLTWMHSEPFNLLSQGEFFKITVVELTKEQSAESGLATNVPVFSKNYISSHQVPYPHDANELEPGKRYAWSVQKISNGNVVSRTEAWEFTIAKITEPKDHMYVALKKKLDGSYYTVQNDRVYFRFDEKYASGDVKCKIYSENRELVTPKVINIQSMSNGDKKVGYNSYELDVQPYKLKDGFYTLEVVNAKKEKFVLKLYIQK